MERRLRDALNPLQKLSLCPIHAAAAVVILPLASDNATMARRDFVAKQAVASATSVLLVGPPSPSLLRKKSLLQQHGFDITLAENICYAEVFAEAQHFDAAVYDDSLPVHEQLSLARVMRIRWPWMRLIACGPAPGNELFDANESSEAELPETLREVLA